MNNEELIKEKKKEKFKKYLEIKDYRNLENIGIVYNINRYITWCSHGTQLGKNFEITHSNKKLWKWFIDNFINFVYFDLHEINKIQKELNENEVTYEDNIILHMGQFFTNSIYFGKKEIAQYLLKQYPKIDKHSFDYSLCCSGCQQTPEMIDTLLAIDDKHYILHDGEIKLKHWINE